MTQAIDALFSALSRQAGYERIAEVAVNEFCLRTQQCRSFYQLGLATQVDANMLRMWLTAQPQGFSCASIAHTEMDLGPCLQLDESVIRHNVLLRSEVVNSTVRYRMEATR